MNEEEDAGSPANGEAPPAVAADAAPEAGTQAAPVMEAPQIRQPRLGDVVIYRPHATNEVYDVGLRHNGANEVPGVVVRLWGGTTVNLHLLLDGPFTYWKTSVSRGDLPGT